MPRLPGDYVAGFVDGEGCFFINFRKDVKYNRTNPLTYFSWKIGFAIVLREDDCEILNLIKETIGCGRVTISKNGFVRYEITKINDLVERVVPFFNLYPLYAKKKNDYLLWKEALLIFSSKDRSNHRIRWTQEENSLIKEIYQKMLKFKGGTRKSKWLDSV